MLVAINPGKRTRQAQDAQRKNDIGALATEVQGYYTSPGSGCYPTGLVVLSNQGYLKQLPTQPAGGAAYQYGTSATPASCTGVNGPTEVSIYATLAEPTGAGTRLWCFQSTSGGAQEITVGSCAP